MNRKLIFICTILLLSLAVISCNHARQSNGNSVLNAESSEADVKQAMNSPAQICAKTEVPVLCFHRIENNYKSTYNVNLAAFSADMKMLADSGYHSISPTQLYDYLVYNRTLPSKPVMITFDDSRVEHALVAAPVLEKYGFRGVFFIMTITFNKKNYMTTAQIAQLEKAGHTVGLHSWDHTMVTKYKDSSDWQKQVVEPKSKLEKIVGKSVEYWAYPNGVFDHKGAKELSKYFKLSFSLASKRDSLLPLQTVRRMIVPDWTPQGMLNAMHRTFGMKKT